MKTKIKEHTKKNGELKIEIILIPDTNNNIDRFECEICELKTFFSTIDRENYFSSNVSPGEVGCFVEYRPEKGQDSYALYLSKTGKPQGKGGNMDTFIERFHGWRGTTCGTACYARGWRKVVSVEERKRGYGWVVTLSKDLLPEEE